MSRPVSDELQGRQGEPALAEVRRPSVPCPRCGRSAARIIGGSESFAVLYLRCDDCRQTSVAPA